MGFVKILASIAILALSVVDAAQLISVDDDKGVIPNSYIVVMKNSVSSADFDSHVTWATNLHHEKLSKRGSTTTGGLKHVYNINGWYGYSGSFDRETLDEILKNENVDFAEHDREVHLNAFVVQPNAPSWGLGRISHRQRGNPDFVYDETAGAGITIYGVDTGIDIKHPDFSGRAVWGINVVGGPDADGNGHGTHTAGTFAGTTFGIAKRATIVAVKVLNDRGGGANSGIIQGINWSVNHAFQTGALGRAVMNLSLGGDRSIAVNLASSSAVMAGVFLAVAAGNENQNAANVSPASALGVCTVAASTENDEKASFSNWGNIVKLYAPGTNIVSTTPNGNNRTLSGTSMAAPHVAGVGAAMMSSQGIAPGAVCNLLIQLAQGLITNPGTDTTNKLLYNGSGQ